MQWEGRLKERKKRRERVEMKGEGWMQWDDR